MEAAPGPPPYVPHRGAGPGPGHCQRRTGSSWPAAGLAESGSVVTAPSPGNTGCGDEGKDSPPGILQGTEPRGGQKSSVSLP